MKYKDLDKTQIFTWWDVDKHLTGVKVDGNQAFCLNDLRLHAIHGNTTVKEPESLPETLQYKVGHDGRSFLCSPMPGGKWLARCVFLLTGEIMHDRDFKQAVSTAKTGEGSRNLDEVYITLSVFEKKMKDLETAFRMVQMILADRLSASLLDNEIMLSSETQKRLSDLVS